MHNDDHMLTHDGVWTAIETVARNKGLSTSGLAKKAGLDATTFNVSKRITADGKRRWPSTESIAKVLEATGTSLSEFISYTGAPGSAPSHHRLPIIRSAQATSDDFFDDEGLPKGAEWDAVIVTDMDQDGVFALEVGGHSMMPVYRRGDVIVVSPLADIRRGDRVVVKTKNGKILARELIRQSERKVELRSVNHEKEETTLPMEQVDWIARIIWAGQ